MFKLKVPKISKKLLYTILSVIITIIVVQQVYVLFFKRENYSSMTMDNEYENQEGLYEADIGVVGTRKDFSHMRKPHLNPIMVPIIKGITE